MESALVASTLALAALWFGFYWIYRDYRVDLFRERLFAIRDELFDLARANEISFEGRAYGMLRGTINGTIRFGHRVNLTDFAFFIIIKLRDDKSKEAAELFRSEWESSLSELSPDTRSKLRVLRGRMHFLMVEQVVCTSITLFTLFVATFLGALIVRCCKGALSSVIRRVLGDRVVDVIGNTFDCAALAEAGTVKRSSAVAV